MFSIYGRLVVKNLILDPSFSLSISQVYKVSFIVPTKNTQDISFTITPKNKR
jgi:hypothetical protein